jgi:DNA-binding transcriptional regulator YdaS (Cro superfamily)
MNEISSHVEKAIRRFGSQAKLAAVTGVAQPTIHKAMATGRVGVRLAQGIERATGGSITKEELRPDIWPPQFASAPAGASTPARAGPPRELPDAS